MNAEQTCASIHNLTGVFNCALGLIGYLLILCGMLALLFFIWNLVMYIKDYDNAAKREESRAYMIYGIIALFVIVSVGGLVRVLENTFNFNRGGSGAAQFGSQRIDSQGIPSEFAE